MILSRYLKQYPCRDNPDKVLLFSTRRRSKAIVPRSILDSFEDGTISPEDRDTLARLGFLVPDEVGERGEVLGALNRAEEQNSHAFLMAVMNLDCNLACTYCYEGKQRGRHYMSAETALLLAQYAEENFLSRGKDLTIDFYGGEPLLSLDLIKEVSRRLKETAGNVGKEYSFTLVTNGTLLTGEVAAELSTIGLKKARVTLDGPRENHDVYRPYASGKGSFDQIICNLKAACGVVRIGIGGNYTRDNYREFPRLLDQLACEGLTPDRIDNVIFAPVTETLGEHLMPEFSEGCASADEPWLVEASVFLREEILRRGYFTPKVCPTVCMIEFSDNLVVHHDGTFYKCPAFIGCEGLDVGDLMGGIRDYRQSHNMDFWKTDECLNCAYLPLCFGGCRFLKLLRHGAIDGVECRKAFFDSTMEKFLLQDLQYHRKIRT
jgi:uncharacterized protein